MFRIKLFPEEGETKLTCGCIIKEDGPVDIICGCGAHFIKYIDTSESSFIRKGFIITCNNTSATTLNASIYLNQPAKYIEIPFLITSTYTEGDLSNE